MSPVSSFLLSPVNYFVTRASVTAGEDVVGSWYVTSQAEPFPMHLENACSRVEISILTDTDDAFEVDGDGDGADDRLDGDLSKSVGDEDAGGNS